MRMCLIPASRLLNRHLKEDHRFFREAILVLALVLSGASASGSCTLLSLNVKRAKKKAMELMAAPAPKLP